jgi:hypothetical protein
MQFWFTTPPRILFFLLLTSSIAGCDRGPKLYPVQGKVSYEGNAPEGASVVFAPVDGDHSKSASGKVQADGSYELETYPHGKGAFPGEYHVTVTWFTGNAREQENPVNKLPQKYATTQTSGLTASVKEGNNEIPPIELK